MRNLTLAIDEEILLEARKLALEQKTTVNSLVREFLAGLVKNGERRAVARAHIKQSMRECRTEVGPRSWTREDLHER